MFEPAELMKHKDKAVELVMGYLPSLLLAILTLLVGLWLVKLIQKGIGKALAHRGVDATLAPFLMNLSGWLLKAVVIISVASIVGVQTTSFVAILGAAGLAVGLALQGSLSNFAGGVLILIFRPYEAGHVIEAQGHIGVVREIQIFTTTLVNAQNRRIIIPNGVLSNGSIVNYTAEGTARVDIAIGIEYGADIDKARQVLLELLSKDARVLKDPAATVVVTELADSSINLSVRPFARVEDYWGVFFDTLENGKVALESAGIGIPFPQRDVHLYQNA
jgi:small conductance mechanosensitive channel